MLKEYTVGRSRLNPFARGYEEHSEIEPNQKLFIRPKTGVKGKKSEKTHCLISRSDTVVLQEVKNDIKNPIVEVNSSNDKKISFLDMLKEAFEAFVISLKYLWSKEATYGHADLEGGHYMKQVKGNYKSGNDLDFNGLLKKTTTNPLEIRATFVKAFDKNVNAIQDDDLQAMLNRLQSCNIQIHKCANGQLVATGNVDTSGYEPKLLELVIQDLRTLHPGINIALVEVVSKPGMFSHGHARAVFIVGKKVLFVDSRSNSMEATRIPKGYKSEKFAMGHQSELSKRCVSYASAYVIRVLSAWHTTKVDSEVEFKNRLWQMKLTPNLEPVSYLQTKFSPLG